MELLKNIIELKRKDVTSTKEKCGKPWIPRREIEEEEKRRRLSVLEEEAVKRKEHELSRFVRLSEFLEKKRRAASGSVGASANGTQEDGANTHAKDQTNSSDAFSFDDSALSDEAPPVPRDEVIRRLRRRGQVVTYFGESDRERYKRLYQLEIAEHGDELMEGQKNVFLQLLEEEGEPHHKAKKHRKNVSASHSDDDEEDEERRSHRAPVPVGREETTLSAASSCTTKLSSPQQTEASEEVEETTDRETRIRQWINKMLRLWGTELDERSEAEKLSATGKVALAQYRQTGKDLKPLLKKLKKRDMDSVVLEKIYDMVVLCEARDYRRAHDKYIELSIGNAAWPMGVTMVGIHERAGRSKIFTSEIAHILNDETTRKYIHMFKRLISFTQRRFPADPSMMVALSTTHV